jgi:hypothetical protein
MLTSGVTRGARRSVGSSQLQFLGDAADADWGASDVLACERGLVNGLRDVWNRWVHRRPFSSDDACRALDSVARLLPAVSAREVDEVERMKRGLLRVRFDHQVRAEKRRHAAAPRDATTSTPVGITPDLLAKWRA